MNKLQELVKRRKELAEAIKELAPVLEQDEQSTHATEQTTKTPPVKIVKSGRSRLMTAAALAAQAASSL